MNPLLTQFLSDSRDALQGISEKLMQLEHEPNDADLMNELFRHVHTLKGNSGLFDFPEMTRVLHAGEDLLDAVRDNQVAYSREFADMLLDAMDFVGQLCDEVECGDSGSARHAVGSVRLAEALRALIVGGAPSDAAAGSEDTPFAGGSASREVKRPHPFRMGEIPEAARMEAFRLAGKDGSLHWLSYSPIEECYFQGDDPFHQARQTPGLVWGDIAAREPWPPLAELDAYSCVLDFHLLTTAPHAELIELYRYVPEQIRVTPLDPLLLILPVGEREGGPACEDFVADLLQHLDARNLAAVTQAARTMLELSNPELWLSSALRWLLVVTESMPDRFDLPRALAASIGPLLPPDWSTLKPVPDRSAVPAPGQPEVEEETGSLTEDAALDAILAAQRQILMLEDRPAWFTGRLKAAACALGNCCLAAGDPGGRTGVEAALEQSLTVGDGAPLADWLALRTGRHAEAATPGPAKVETDPTGEAAFAPTPPAAADALSSQEPAQSEGSPKFGRRYEDQGSAKSLRVDQVKIDRLMDLIGEMVVSKNGLPYLAQRAENHFGVRELAREIKVQYSVINRIAEEMQDAIMQVQMMPVSFVFQRFPRLVRDISRKLGKEVALVLEGEETEADKNIIESLADPLIHIIRNSLDHGLETPELRRALGKPETGTITIRAAQEADRVVIEISDDGKGIDPAVIKRKAYEKGVIDEASLERITDREAVNLVFAAGFSTADTVSDLSGRGVGMDVVRTGVERVGGAIRLESEVGKGTAIRISLPLSMAVTRVMIIESDRQIFGVPMDHVVETVRVPVSAVHTVKKSKTAVLRGRIVPLKSLNGLLGLSAETVLNVDRELAVLVARVGGQVVGLMVDDFCETIDIIQKPLTGVLSGLSAYSGSALMGDGSVLMVLNLKEVIRCP